MQKVYAKLTGVTQSRQMRNRILRIGVAFGLTLLLLQVGFDPFETYSYDMRIKFKTKSSVSGHIQTVAIDQDTVRDLRRSPNARDHIEFLKRLSKEQPRAIVYLVHPKELVGSYEELQEFANLATGLNNFFVVSEKLNLKGEDGRLEMLPPFTGIKVVPGPKLEDNGSLTGEGVIRRMLISYEHRPTIHPILSAQFNGIYTDDKVRGLIENDSMHEAFIDYHPTGTYKSLSFSKILNGNFSSSDITNKIIILGRDTEGSNKDYVETPYSYDPMAMTLLELHANLFDTVIQNRAVIRAPDWLDFAITFSVALLIVYTVMAIKPVYGIGILFATILSFIVLSVGTFSAFNFAVEMAHPLMAIFICYYFLIPYRLILENRKSWEYFQKNKILSQVEELKSNFLSMMSHDIKTPLARIQGMVDVIRRDPASLGDQQNQALDSISQSARDLTSFISSLLDVGRVESKGIQLHMTSKDVNSLISDVIEKFDFVAKEKGIQLITEFEPLFSIKFDVELMRQVFSNLIENALKYSEPGSKVLITTEESNGKILIQVADQGVGIAETELPNIFMKFYRSKEAKSSKVKGTGVGLYLARYFVELHQGKIDVESKINQGSTFTVNLPMNL